jgi:CheY-like chemotaxis protein
MESVAKLISAVSSLAWPLIAGIFLIKFFQPLRSLIESAKGRKICIKVGGNELTVEEASEQQSERLIDLQSKLAAIESRLAIKGEAIQTFDLLFEPSKKCILWVDDMPRNNSFLVASIQSQGYEVDIALSTDNAISMFRNGSYDIVISDMNRPNDKKAGITLARNIRNLKSDVPIYIFCGNWAARNLREEALNNGITDITSSGTTLLSMLLLKIAPKN